MVTKQEQKFMTKSNLKFGGRFQLVDYEFRKYTKNLDRLVKMKCKDHGDFIVASKHHLTSNDGGCSCCLEGTRSLQLKLKYSKRLVEILGSHIDLPEIFTTQEMVLNCHKHGVFTKRLHDVLRGQSCPECVEVFDSFSKTQFVENCAKSGNSVLYVLLCKSQDEEFIKVGITSKSVKLRYKSKSSMPYQYTILNEVTGDACDIWDLEKLIQKTMRKDFKYKPENRFKGSKYECYKF